MARSTFLAVAFLICSAAFAAAQMNHMSMGSMSAPALVLPIPCVRNPKSAQCARYVYPSQSITADTNSLCRDMPFMAACSVSARCRKATGKAAVGRQPATCDPFTLLVTICKVDSMMKMKGCANYASMCRPGSKVAQCANKGLSYLPTTTQANDLSAALCKQMPMDGCDVCPASTPGRKFPMCDLLSVYGRICFDMPTHSECGPWNSACKADPTLFICRSQK